MFVANQLLFSNLWFVKTSRVFEMSNC